MRRSLKTIVGVMAGLLGCTSLTAVVQDAPTGRFEGIPERNAFGLKPPPKVESNTPPPQLAKIVLTGITTILGNKRALMKVHPVGAKPADQGKENSLILTEGQREGDIEVIEINEGAGSVKVSNAGTVMTLTFEKDGAKLPATPVPAVAASGLPPVPTGPPLPLPNPNNPNTALTNAAGIRPLPTRRFRVPTTQGVSTSAPGTTGAAIAGSAPPAVPPMPTVQPAPGVQQPTQPAQDMTPEEQAILQQVQREAAAGAGLAPTATPPVPGQAVYPQ